MNRPESARSGGSDELSRVETLWMPPRVPRPSARTDQNNGSSPLGSVPRVALVEGSQPASLSEDLPLIRLRLRTFLIPLFLGFLIFFVRNLFLKQNDPAILVTQLAILVALGISLAFVVGRRPLELRTLRMMEVAAVAVLAGFFLLMEARLLVLSARANDPLEGFDTIRSATFNTFILMVLYGLLIPSTVRRSAKVVIPMAFGPPLTALIMQGLYPEVRDLAGSFATVVRTTDNAILLLLGAITSLYGIHTLNSLRQEVQQARRLGQYVLRDRLGTGGMGEVFLAEHRMLKRPAAIKLIRAEAAVEPRALARFELEVQATASLSHPNTIEIYDYGRATDGTFYYVMEYLPGLSLATLVNRFGPLPPGRVVHLMTQVCGSLVEAHALGLIHRDLKPANIFAARRGGRYDVAKVLDFGLVKPVLGPAEQPDLSTEGSVKGSPLYMAPEQATGKELDARTDLYALGAVAYFLLTAKPPFDGTSAVEVMVAHARDPVRLPSRLRTEIPTDLERVIMRCLEKAPGDRFQSATELDKALAACSCASEWCFEQAAEWWTRHHEEHPRTEQTGHA